MKYPEVEELGTPRRDSGPYLLHGVKNDPQPTWDKDGELSVGAELQQERAKVVPIPAVHKATTQYDQIHSRR